MLPYTPLHHLLMAQIGRPIVATSGNLSDEPICIDEFEALETLGKIADVFLVHNRRIVRQVDDSVVRLMAGRELVLRRARGYAGFERIGHLREFELPGGEAAIREPRRSAVGLLFQIFGDATFAMTSLPPLQMFSRTESSILQTMLERKLNLPRTTSAGRLFDAIASLVGVRQFTAYEGQAASELEYKASGTPPSV